MGIASLRVGVEKLLKRRNKTLRTSREILILKYKERWPSGSRQQVANLCANPLRTRGARGEARLNRTRRLRGEANPTRLVRSLRSRAKPKNPFFFCGSPQTPRRRKERQGFFWFCFAATMVILTQCAEPKATREGVDSRLKKYRKTDKVRDNLWRLFVALNK